MLDSRSERHLHLRRDMLYTHHSERTARHDEHHLPPHEIDQSKREDEEEERDGLLQMDAEDDREWRLDTEMVSCYLDYEQTTQRFKDSHPLHCAQLVRHTLYQSLHRVHALHHQIEAPAQAGH
jgi:hypothetical protein